MAFARAMSSPAILVVLLIAHQAYSTPMPTEHRALEDQLDEVFESPTTRPLRTAPTLRFSISRHAGYAEKNVVVPGVLQQDYCLLR